MEKGNPERRNLKVNSVGQVEEKPRKDGQGTFKTISFTADDITDPDVKKGYVYSVANPILIPIIEVAKKDDILEADVRKLTGEREDGTEWTIHQVVQLYKDGQQIGGQKKPWGKSIETVKLELESKAKNTALMLACELATADKVDKDQILAYATKFLGWLQNGEDTKEKKPKPAPAPKTTSNILEFKTGVELTNYALKHGFTLDKIKEYLSINNPIEITDVKAAKEVLFPSEKD